MTFFRVAGVSLCAMALCAQLPKSGGEKATISGSQAAIVGSKQDPAAVERGGKLFAAKCGGCHGLTAKGTTRAPDLVRSLLVLGDEKGIFIAPVIHNGRPDKGMPKFDMSDSDVADIVAWLHVQTYAADHRGTYVFLDVVTGNAKKGEAYFQANCAQCHSAAGDMKGIGGKYDPHTLQGRWIQPRRTAKAPQKVTVTLPSGQSFTGTLDRLDDFNVALRDAAGDFHSFNRDGDVPKVQVDDPLKAHTEMLRKYTDPDIHNVTAYLVTLK